MYSNNRKTTPQPFARLIKFLRTLFSADTDSGLLGKPLGYSYSVVDKRTRTSLEPRFNAVRSPEMAYALENLKAISGDAQNTLIRAATDVFSSQDGDVVGFYVDEFLDKERTIKTDPDVLSISKELFDRKQNDNEYVIGGNHLERAVEEFLLTGDSFLEIGYSKRKGKNEYYVSSTRFLPVWEMFTVVDENTGMLSHYEQRKSFHDTTPIIFEPWKIVQFSYRRVNLYGQSIFNWQSIEAAKALREANHDIQNRSKTMSINPDMFTMPDGFNMGKAQAYESYIRDKQARREDDLILMLHGMTYQKGAATEPDLSSQLDYIRDLRLQIVPGGFPLWCYPGLGDESKDLLGQPSAVYSRLRNSFCGIVARGVREVLDNELILRLGVNRYQEIMKNGGYNIKFPAFIVNPNLVNQYDQDDDEETQVSKPAKSKKPDKSKEPDELSDDKSGDESSEPEENSNNEDDE